MTGKQFTVATTTIAIAVIAAFAYLMFLAAPFECRAVDKNGWPIVPAGPGPASWLICWDVPNAAMTHGVYTVVGTPHEMPGVAKDVRGLEECTNPGINQIPSRNGAS